MYEKSITREHRTAFIFAIDQSGSMNERISYNSRNMTKGEIVCEIANSMLAELLERARRSDGVRNYYDVAVLGYSSDRVESLLDNDRIFVPVNELEDMGEMTTVALTRRLPNGSVALHNVECKRWFSARCEGETPMYEALNTVYVALKKWCDNPDNRDSYPPIIFNITDGVSSDSDIDDILYISNMIKGLGTRDGAVMLVNIHLAFSTIGRENIIFPTEQEIAQSEDRYLRMLFNSASDMPESMYSEVVELRGDVPDTISRPIFKAMSYNTSIASLISILNIGSISVRKL